MLLARTPCFSFSYSSCTVQQHSATLQPHSSKGRPAWSPSMLLMAAVAAAAVALPLSSMWQQQSSLLPRKQARPLPQPPHTGGNAGARQALRRSLCGALSAHSALLLHLRRITSPPAAGAHLAERRQQLPARCALTRAAVSRRRKAQELEQGSKESRWNSMATPWACGSWRGVLMGKGASWGGRVSRFEPPSVRLDTSSRE